MVPQITVTLSDNNRPAFMKVFEQTAIDKIAGESVEVNFHRRLRDNMPCTVESQFPKRLIQLHPLDKLSPLFKDWCTEADITYSGMFVHWIASSDHR